MTLRVRTATAADAPAIRAVHVAAFPTALEADLVETLVRDGDAVLSLVAEAAGEIRGHVLLSRMRAGGDGREYRALGLGPVAVPPEHQRRGIGSALIRAAIDSARAQGEQLIFLLGEPAYYCRFGFSAAAARPFASPYAGDYFLALPLDGSGAPAARGTAEYTAAFSELGEGQ